MIVTEKNSEEYVNNIIVPIEQKKNDSGNLYVFVNSSPILDFNTLVFNDYDEKTLNRQDFWSFPTENGPGEWVERDNIKLETLTAIIFRNASSQGGYLFKAEYKGKKKIYEMKGNMWPQNKNQQNQIDPHDRLYQLLDLGVIVNKARLTIRIKPCNLFLFWSFAIDCIEHSYSLYREIFPESYKKGIFFARAYSKYMCGKGYIDLENLFDKPIGDKVMLSTLAGKMRDEVEGLVSKDLGFIDFEKNSIGKAILDSLHLPFPFNVSEYVRTAHAQLQSDKFRAENEIPHVREDSFYHADKYKEEERILSRIWYAFYKEELDWQVNHFREMIGD